jgi:hypothetical protein
VNTGNVVPVPGIFIGAGIYKCIDFMQSSQRLTKCRGNGRWRRGIFLVFVGNFAHCEFWLASLTIGRDECVPLLRVDVRKAPENMATSAVNGFSMAWSDFLNYL